MPHERIQVGEGGGVQGGDQPTVDGQGAIIVYKKPVMMSEAVIWSRFRFVGGKGFKDRLKAMGVVARFLFGEGT